MFKRFSLHRNPSFQHSIFSTQYHQKKFTASETMNHSPHPTSRRSIANRILLDINARVCIKYDHLDNKDVESGEEKLQPDDEERNLDCHGHFLSAFEAAAEEKLCLKSN
jgi:hypothetical protein